jgi:hypothetical protein
MVANEVVLQTHRHVGRGKQRGAVFFVDQEVETSMPSSASPGM